MKVKVGWVVTKLTMRIKLTLFNYIQRCVTWIKELFTIKFFGNIKKYKMISLMS